MKKRKKIFLVAVAICSILSIFAVSASAYQSSTAMLHGPEMRSGEFTSALVPIADLYATTLNVSDTSLQLTQSYNIPNDYYLYKKGFFTLNEELGRGSETLSSFNPSYGLYSFVLFDSYQNTWGVPLDGFPIEDYAFFADSVTYGIGSPPDCYNVDVYYQFGNFITNLELIDEILSMNVVSTSGNVHSLLCQFTLTFYDVAHSMWVNVDQESTIEHDNQVMQDWVAPWRTTYEDVYINTYNIGQKIAERIAELVAISEVIYPADAPIFISNFQVSTDHSLSDQDVIFNSLTSTFIRTDSRANPPIHFITSDVRSMMYQVWVEYANGFPTPEPPTPTPTPPSVDDIDLSAVGNMLGTAVDGFFDVEILPNLTIRLLFGAIIGILVFVAFLRYFAGG